MMSKNIEEVTTVVTTDVTKTKEYFCFICDAKSTEKGLPLLLSETTYSQICLGQKLQEILGEKFIVLIKPKDSVCWNCAEVINWVDKYEIRIDIAKDNLLTQILKKYKKIEMCLTNEGSLDQVEKPKVVNYDEGPVEEVKSRVDDYRDPPYTPKTRPAVQATYTPFGSKRKKYPCNVCHKLYATAAAAGAHAAKVHRSQYSCDLCDQVFSSEKKYKAHMSVHDNIAPVETPKLLSCVSCGFKATNTEVYCRHVCNSSIMSLTCSTCRKRYVDSRSSKDGSEYQCQSCKKLREPELTTRFVPPVKNKSVLNKPDKPLPETNTYFKPAETEELSKDDDNLSHQNGVNVEFVEDQGEDQEEENRDEWIQEQETIVNDELNPEMEINEETPLEEGNLTDDMMVSGETEVVSEKQDEFVINEQVSYLKCTNCDEEFELSQLASHQCFVRGDVIEFSEVERQVGPEYYSVPFNKEDGHENQQKPARRRRIPKIPAQENSYVNLNANATRMHCKTCGAEFKTINLLRQHWKLTGHIREVSTTTIELNKIKDKTRKTEKTFKVVKQNFHIRANVVGQNDEEIKKNEELQMNCIIKVRPEISVEEFIEMKGGKECETCGILFGSEALLKEHQQIDCLTCITCGVIFLDNKLLKKHYQYTGHANRITIKPPEDHPVDQMLESFNCHICHEAFFSRFVLGKHLRKHYKGTDKGACHYCQKEFDDKSEIQQHVLEIHGAQLYKCQHCDRTFLSESVRNRHQLKHKEYNCKICKIKLASQRLLMVHMDQMHRRSLSCRICGKIIIDLQTLKRHEKSHFYGKSLQCDLCTKTFRSKAILKAHSVIHQNETSFVCKTCGLGFKTQENLEEHQIMHIKKEFMCPKCSIVCPSRTYFWMHMKHHEAAYVCSVCGRMFRDTSLLAVHRRKHWRVRPYQCPHCPRAFSVPATLRRHLTVHTRAFPHRCVLCKKGFLTRYAFHKHLDTVHSVRQSQPTKHDKKIPSLPLNATDEDLFQAADTLICDDTLMFNDFPQKDITIEQVSSNDLITNEVVVETTELFDVLT